MAKMNHILLYGNYEQVFDTMSDANVGKLIRSALHLLNTGEDVPPSGPARVVWSLMKDQILRNMAKYEEVCERNRENSQKFWDNKKQEAMDKLKYSAY